MAANPDDYDLEDEYMRQCYPHHDRCYICLNCGAVFDIDDQVQHYDTSSSAKTIYREVTA